MCSHPRQQRGTGILPVIPALCAFFFSVSATPANDLPAITLTDIHGKTATPLAFDAETKAAVVIFTTTDCPIANGYAPEIVRIVTKYAKLGVTFTLAHVDPDLENDKAVKHASEYGYDRIAVKAAEGRSGSSVTLVIDRVHALVKAAGATTTPEAAVFTPDGKVVYLGRIDDLYTGFGDRRNAPAEHNLRDALDAVLAGVPVKVDRTATVGCIIEPLAE